MEHRAFGKTGLEVSALGFGGSPLGGVFGAVDESECIRTVHAALDAGINLFDVAPFYGETRAETMLGKNLGAKAVEFINAGLVIARNRNDRGAEQQFLELTEAASLGVEIPVCTVEGTRFGIPYLAG